MQKLSNKMKLGLIESLIQQDENIMITDCFGVECIEVQEIIEVDGAYYFCLPDDYVIADNKKRKAK